MIINKYRVIFFIPKQIIITLIYLSSYLIDIILFIAVFYILRERPICAKASSVKKAFYLS